MQLTDVKSFESSVFTLNFVKQYIKIDHDDDDDIIAMMIKSAELYAERMTGITLSRRECIVTFNPVEISDNAVKIDLKPVLHINHVRAYNVKLERDIDYNVNDANNVINFIISIHTNIIVNLDVGHTSMSEISTDLQHAVLNHVSHMYDNRGALARDIAPAAVNTFYLSFKKWKF